MASYYLYEDNEVSPHPPHGFTPFPVEQFDATSHQALSTAGSYFGNVPWASNFDPIISRTSTCEEGLSSSNSSLESHGFGSSVAPVQANGSSVPSAIDDRLLNCSLGPLRFETDLSVPTNSENKQLESSGTGANPKKRKRPSYSCDKCKSVFTRKADLTRHYESLHPNDGSVWFCGLCYGDSEQEPWVSPNVYNRKRKDHVVQHIRSRHDRNATGLQVCELNGCCVEGRSYGLVFNSPSSLQQHNSRKHPEGPVAVNMDPKAFNPARAREPGKIGFDANGGLPSISSGQKRFTGPLRDNIGGSPPWSPLEASYQAVHPQQLRPRRQWEVIEIPEVKITEFASLKQSNDIYKTQDILSSHRTAATKSTASGHVEFGGMSFNLLNHSIQLRGPEYLVKYLSEQVRSALKDFRRCTNGESSPQSVYKHVGNLSPPEPSFDGKENRCSEIYPMRVDQDGPLIKLWKTNLLPALPKILREYLGPDYSATLVRQGQSELASSAVIRIQSPYKKGPAIRKSIRAAIGDVCQRQGVEPMHTQFSNGYVSVLAGSLDSGYDDGCDEEEVPDEFPYHWDFWKYVGMSASIGLEDNNQVAGTLGGYVRVRGNTYALTTKHFIDAAQASMTDSSPIPHLGVTSPSLFHVHYLKRRLRLNLAEVEERIKQRFESSSNISLSEIDDDESAYIYSKLEPLSRHDNGFLIGEVKYRCGKSRKELPHDNHLGEASAGSPRYRIMDWALCSVREDRRGENRHRFRYDENTQQPIIGSEGAYPRGQGEHCLHACSVPPGGRVYYVGAQTGLQQGTINAVESLYSRADEVSHEWGMIPTNSPLKRHNGDSGAWIMHDDKVCGMLWGENKVMQGRGRPMETMELFFTPILEIFDQICDDLPFSKVDLPPSREQWDAVDMIAWVGELPSKLKPFKLPISKRCETESNGSSRQASSRLRTPTPSPVPTLCTTSAASSQSDDLPPSRLSPLVSKPVDESEKSHNESLMKHCHFSEEPDLHKLTSSLSATSLDADVTDLVIIPPERP